MNSPAAVPCTYVRSVFPRTPLYGKSAEFAAVFGEKQSSQVKSVNYLSVGRNLFTESCFSEQQHGCPETRETIRFRAKSRSSVKSIGVTYGQDIITAILSGFNNNRFFTMQRSKCNGERTGFAVSLSEFWRKFEYECTQ